MKFLCRQVAGKGEIKGEIKGESPSMSNINGDFLFSERGKAATV